MWPFAPRQKPLREQVEEKRLSLQLQLLESASNLYDQFADPRDAVFDDSSDFWPNSWSAHVPSNLDNSKRGENLPVYLNWYQLKVARDNSRRLCSMNEFAINALENRISYIVGKGFKYQAVRRDNPDTPEDESGDGDDSLAREVNDYLREWMDGSDWESTEQEIARRCDCDGECFIRFFETANGVEYRFIEPEHVQAPNESGPDTFGIQTDTDDVCTVLGYWVIEDPIEKRAPVLVPASEILHIRLNVNSVAKRGLPTFYPIRKNLERADKLLRNMSVLAQVQATFAVIRKHSGASASAVSAFQQAQADAMYSSPVTGNTKYLQALQPGSIIDSNLQTEYEFPGGSINAASYVEILQAELRAIAARLVMPEYMLTADASNANFASTLVAESPSVKNFERLQSFYARKFGRGCYYQGKNSGVLWRVIVHGAESGKLNPQVLDEIEIQATGPSLTVRDRAADTTRYQTLNSARVLSKETWAQLEELDYEQEKRKLEQEPVDINSALLAVPEVGKPPKPEPPKSVTESGGHWRTINGAHVYIEDGKVTKGPVQLLSKGGTRINALSTKLNKGQRVEGYHSFTGVDRHEFSGTVESLDLDTAGGGFGTAKVKLDKPITVYDGDERQHILLQTDKKYTFHSHEHTQLTKEVENLDKLAGFHDVKAKGSGHIDGWHVEHAGGDQFRIQTDRGAIVGDAAKISDHINHRSRNEQSEGKRIQEAFARADAYDEPNFMDNRAHEDAAAFAALPNGTRVVSLAGTTRGRIGRIVRTDEGGRLINRVKLDGEAGLSMTSEVEPLDAKYSWRVPKEEKEPEPTLRQKSMFEGKTTLLEGKWITIGSDKSAPPGKKGGTPVYIENGKITKGHPGLVGKSIDALDEEGESKEGRSATHHEKQYHRAKWGKQAREQGFDPKDLHQLTAELMAHDAAYKADIHEVLQAARKASKARGYGDIGNLRTLAGRGSVEDAASVKGLDDIAKSLSASYPHIVGAEHEAEGKLFELLSAGNPAALSEEDAYSQAFDHLMEMKAEGRYTKKKAEVVPF